MNAHHWPGLSKIVVAYVKTDFSRWTWEGDQSDDMDEYGSADIMDAERDSAFENGQLLEEVFLLRTKVYHLANNIQAKSILNRVQRHNSYSSVGTAKLPN